MKKELKYFTIDGAFGGNQEWFTNVVMYMGGCAAATACDSCIYFAKYMAAGALYPYDSEHLTKKEYIAFSQKMKPYLKPRIRGVNRLWMFTDGFREYREQAMKEKGLQELPVSAEMEEFSGEHSVAEAEAFIKKQINAGIPIPYLMLQHQNREKYKDFIWHWFLVAGYEERKTASGSEFYIKAATYGEETWFLLSDLWKTGSEEKGGMIGYHVG